MIGRYVATLLLLAVFLHGKYQYGARADNQDRNNMFWMVDNADVLLQLEQMLNDLNGMTIIEMVKFCAKFEPNENYWHLITKYRPDDMHKFASVCKPFPDPNGNTQQTSGKYRRPLGRKSQTVVMGGGSDFGKLAGFNYMQSAHNRLRQNYPPSRGNKNNGNNMGAREPMSGMLFPQGPSLPQEYPPTAMNSNYNNKQGSAPPSHLGYSDNENVMNGRGQNGNTQPYAAPIRASPQNDHTNAIDPAKHQTGDNFGNIMDEILSEFGLEIPNSIRSDPNELRMDKVDNNMRNKGRYPQKAYPAKYSMNENKISKSNPNELRMDTDFGAVDNNMHNQGRYPQYPQKSHHAKISINENFGSGSIHGASNSNNRGGYNAGIMSRRAKPPNVRPSENKRKQFFFDPPTDAANDDDELQEPLDTHEEVQRRVGADNKESSDVAPEKGLWYLDVPYDALSEVKNIADDLKRECSQSSPDSQPSSDPQPSPDINEIQNTGIMLGLSMFEKLTRLFDSFQKKE